MIKNVLNHPHRVVMDLLVTLDFYIGRNYIDVNKVIDIILSRRKQLLLRLLCYGKKAKLML